MASTDRAFRALARASPEVVLALARAATGERAPQGRTVLLDDPNLDLPPHPKEADLILQVGEDEVDHFECQGYGQKIFPDRLFHYHLVLVLRHPTKRVRSLAIWTRIPSREQRRGLIRRGDVTVRVTHVVLPEIPARRLLRDPATVCFAAGAALGGWTVERLCDRVAQAMVAKGAPYEEQLMAAMVAAAQKRYPQMIAAMENAKMQPVMIQDLVDYGMERGIARGLEQGIDRGIEQGLERGTRAIRDTLRDILEARGLPVDAAVLARIDAEDDLHVLRSWCRAAITAQTAEAALGGG